MRGAEIRKAIKELVEKETDDVAIPPDLNEQVVARLKEYPAESWDAAVRVIAARIADDDGAAGDDGGAP